jgi:arylsulfatase A-like enzyme
MNRRTFLRNSLAAPASFAFASQVKGDRPTNVVFIISDDQAWTDYGFMGHSVIRTPRLDALAKESVTFTRGYAAAPLCCPSLASMISGLHPHQSKITSNDPPKLGEKPWTPERLALRKQMIE